jgi:hypothetical protein
MQRSARANRTRLPTPPDPHTLITFIEEVAAHVREQVTERPASSFPATDEQIEDLQQRHPGRTKEDEHNEHHPRN